MFWKLTGYTSIRPELNTAEIKKLINGMLAAKPEDRLSAKEILESELL